MISEFLPLQEAIVGSLDHQSWVSCTLLISHPLWNRLVKLPNIRRSSTITE